jgi:PRC-barrel domain
MRRIVRIFASAMLGAAALIALDAPALGQQAVLVSADVATFENGYRTGFMQGSKVFNERKERIGTIADFVLVRDLAPAAILQVGGFLEMGSHFVAVPFKSFMIENSGRRIMLPGATREALRNFPEFKFRN